MNEMSEYVLSPKDPFWKKKYGLSLDKSKWL